MMLRRLQVVRDERGVALVMAIVTMAVLAAAMTTAVFAASSSGNTANRSKATQNADALAEAGIASAMAMLKLPTNNALDPTVFCATVTQTTPCTTHDVYGTGYVDWYGVLTGTQWTLTSIGSIANPTSPTAGLVTKKLTATVNVHPTLTQPLNTPIWNYMYATKLASPLGTCDMTVTSS